MEGEGLVNSEDAHGGVANLSSETRMRPAGEALCVCDGVQKAGGPGHFEDMQESSTSVPPHLQDLLQRSLVCLSGEQANEVKEVLTQYVDVFSKGDHDLGRASLVKHHIHTGDSRPVKLPPQRITPAWRTEVEKPVEELHVQGVIEKSCSL